jgi:hypothetical protein
MILEYRKTGIQEYKYDLSCSPLLFSMCGGNDNYDTGIQEYRKYKDDLF